MWGDRASPSGRWWLVVAAGVLLAGWFNATFTGSLDGLFDEHGVPVGYDFINIWSAGRLTIEGQAGMLHDREAYREAQDTLFGRDIPSHNWSYPPLFIPVAACFGLLDYLPAYLLWMALIGLAYLMAARAAGLRGGMPSSTT